MMGLQFRSDMMINGQVPSEWQVKAWLNSHDEAYRLEDLRGQVVAIHCFQMLCPGCVAHGIPQAKRIQQTFPPSRVRVIGLHTVFEHHAAMNIDALRAFLYEYRISFPVAVDQADDRGSPIPMTMQSWGLEGTPTLIILDAQGRVRLNEFGQADDLQVGTVIGRCLAELDAAPSQ